jgi:acetyl-CoA carboxylase carboxyltransferase component
MVEKQEAGMADPKTREFQNVTTSQKEWRPMQNKIKEVEERRKRLYEAGGTIAIERQHKMGKLTARERINLLLDQGTFQEVDLWIRPIKTGFDIDSRELPGDAIITGFGKVRGRPCYVISEDFTVLGGTFGLAFHHKITRMMEMAIDNGIPFIQFIDSGGERVQNLFGRTGYRPVLGGLGTFAGTSSLYYAPGKASGVIPQITLMVGPSYAGSAYSPTMADFYIMRKGIAFMSVASPELLKAVTFKNVTQEEIGGSVLHATVSGIADFLVDSDEKIIEICQDLFSYIPLNYTQKPPIVNLGDAPDRKNEDLLEIVPEDLSKPYDMHAVIRSIVDKGEFLELQELFARSIIIGFGRLDGKTIGIVANNPAESAGILTLDTCDKQARFIRWCDAFKVPLVFLVDTPGFLVNPEDEQSRDGLLRTVPKTTFAICESTVPKVSVTIGRCYGVARMVMGTLRMGIDFAYEWPSARAARINPQDAVSAIYKREIEASPTPQKVREEKCVELLKNYINFPYHAGEQGMVNDIIDPRDTRSVLIKSLQNLDHKLPPTRRERKHSLMPQ